MIKKAPLRRKQTVGQGCRVLCGNTGCSCILRGR